MATRSRNSRRPHTLLNRLGLPLLLVVCLASPSRAERGAADAELPEIVFAVRQPGAGGHWYENFGHSAFDTSHKLYGRQGRLCRFDPHTGQLDVLLEDPDGAVRDPQVHHDGRKILFSYRPGGTDYFHLYEWSLEDAELRQLTSGPFDDIEPTYLPNGRIMFCSSRCNRWVPCWYTPVAILYSCDADGGNVYPRLGEYRTR